MQVIHHRNNHILFSFLHPHFRVLENTFVRRPSGIRNPFDTVIFTQRRTADLNPGFCQFHPVINTVYHFIDILTPPIRQAGRLAILLMNCFIRKRLCLLRITDIIELDTIDIISVYQFFHQRQNIIGSLRHPRIKIPFAIMTLTQFRFALHNGQFSLFLHSLIRTNRKCHKPGMAFHPPFVTFFYCKCQRIISGHRSVFS